MTKIIRAAGGVLVDPDRKGRFLVVHRPHRNDWSFPKGKLAGRESSDECAYREVLEETGFRCELVEELTPVHYVTPARNLKVVRYWLMRPVGGTFTINDEVDAHTWLKRDQALALLTHAHDHTVVVEAHRRIREVRRAQKRARRARAAAAAARG